MIYSQVVNTGTATYIVVCRAEAEKAAFLKECEEDGHFLRDVSPSDVHLDKVEFLDWNPA